MEHIRAALARRVKARLDAPHRTKAAVLLLVHPTAEGLALLFTRRTQDVLTHKGQISFPGGSRAPGDRDRLATALRETREELGIAPATLEVLGELDDTLTASSHFLVTPYVAFYAGALEALRPEPREVAEVLSIPLAALQDPAVRRQQQLPIEGRLTAMDSYQYGSHVIWGATARILDQFLEAIAS